MSKTLVIFDFDGTIVDSMQLAIIGARKTLQQMNLPDFPDDEMLRKVNGPTMEETSELLNVPPNLQQDYIRQCSGNNMELLPTLQRCFDGIPEMLEKISGSASVAIASNGKNEYISKSLDMLNLWKYFSHVLTSSTGMPKEKQIETLLKSVHPSKAIMVGDRAGDIRAGKLNGLPTICTKYGYGTAEEWAMADDTAQNVNELAEKLMKFCT